MANPKVRAKILDYVKDCGCENVLPDVLDDGLRIAFLHNRLNDLIDEHMAGRGLTTSQAEILQVLFHCSDEVLTPADLADMIGLSRSAMTSALDSLERAGRIERQPHPSDRRRVAIVLADGADEYARDFLHFKYRRMSRVVSQLSKTERDELIRINEKIMGILSVDLKEYRS